MTIQRRGIVARVIILALLLSAFPVLAAEEPLQPPPSTLMGQITLQEGGKAADVTVIAYHLSSGNLVRSSPTAENGRFEISGLTNGYYDLAVEAREGLFVVNQVINVPPGGTAAVNLQLSDPDSNGKTPRDFPGATEPPAGRAQIVEKSRKKTALWATAGGVGVLLLVGGLSNSDSGSSSTGNVSPSAPPE